MSAQHVINKKCNIFNSSENLNTRPLVRKQVDFLADQLIFQQLAQMDKWEVVTLNYKKN